MKRVWPQEKANPKRTLNTVKLHWKTRCATQKCMTVKWHVLQFRWFNLDNFKSTRNAFVCCCIAEISANQKKTILNGIKQKKSPSEIRFWSGPQPSPLTQQCQFLPLLLLDMLRKNSMNFSNNETKPNLFFWNAF